MGRIAAREFIQGNEGGNQQRKETIVSYPEWISAMRANISSRGWLWLTAAACAATVLVGWALWPRPAAVPQARQYLDSSACLLTDTRGVVPGSAGAPVWASLEQASLATHVMVSYLSAVGPANVPVLLNTLVQRRCGVIITSGAAPAQVAKVARANPGQRFLAVTSTGSAVPMPANAAAVSAAAAPARIHQALRALAAAAQQPESSALPSGCCLRSAES